MYENINIDRTTMVYYAQFMISQNDGNFGLSNLLFIFKQPIYMEASKEEQVNFHNYY